MGVYTGSGPSTDPVVGTSISASAFGVPVADAIQALAGAWTAYTPSWTGATTNPAIGNGTLEGYYTQVGKLVMFRIRLTMGSTTTYGTGQWRFTVPTAAVAILSGASEMIANASCYDTSVPTRFARTGYLSTTTLVVLQDQGGTAVSATAPFTWATGDSLSINGMYEAA